MSLKKKEKHSDKRKAKVYSKRIFNLFLAIMVILQLVLPVVSYADASSSGNDAVDVQSQEAEANADSNVDTPLTIKSTVEEPEEMEEVVEPEQTPRLPPAETEESPEEVVAEPVNDPEEQTNQQPPPTSETENEAEPEKAPQTDSDAEEVEKVEEPVEVEEEEEAVEEEIEEATTLSFEADGVRVEVFGEAGVIPKGTELSLEPLTEAETDLYLNAIEENTDMMMGYVTLFNIHLLDVDGNKIQPNGEVSVSFHGLDQIKPTDDVFIYHAESAASNQRMQHANYSSNVKLEDFSPTLESGNVSFNTDHFSIYIVGTNIRHENTGNRYQMYMGETIQLEERNNYSPSRRWSTEGDSVSIIPNGNRVTVNAVRPGNASVRYHAGTFIFPYYNYFHITVSRQPSNDNLIPAKPPKTDPDALPPGTVAAEKTARWVDYSNRIAEINLSVEGMPIVSGSDVILVMDVSGSMVDDNRISTAQAASNKFIDSLLGEENPLNNRVAFIPFEGEWGGTNETDSHTRGSRNFTYDANELANYVNSTVAEGGTNYTAALNKAISYANSRRSTETSRPLYVVFMSDGSPGRSGESPNDSNWNGTVQATTLKNSGATIYTVGIQLTGTAPQILSRLSSTVNGQTLYQGVSNMNQLQPVLETIAGEIKIAGTNAVFKDYLSEYFNFYNKAPYHTGHGTHANGVVTIPVGNINEDAKMYKIYVQLKDEYRLVENNYPTNSDIHLNYKDVEEKNAHKDKNEIGHPHLSVGYGTVNVRYALVNEKGQYITRDTGIVVDPQFREYVPVQNYAHLFEYDGDTRLEVLETYTVSPTVPLGYKLYVEGETINQEVTWENTNPTVEFKVTRTPIVKEEIVATKHWVKGENARPDTWYFQLWRTAAINGEETHEPVAVKEIPTQGETVTVTFSDVEQNDSLGNQYTFYVKEGTYKNGAFTEAIPEHFVRSGNGLELTNTYQIPTEGMATATKVWEGGMESEYSAVELTLWRTTNDKDFEKVEAPNLVVLPQSDGATSYQYEWSQLDETDASGQSYNYYFTEDHVPDGYERIYSNDALDVRGIQYEPSGGTVRNIKMTLDFSFTKVDENGEALVGAEFTLEKEGDGAPIVNTGTDPNYIFEDLTEGRYILTETKAPAEYKRPSTGWIIEVVRKEETGVLEIRIPEDPYLAGSDNGYLLSNEPQSEFPQTGGIGVMSFIVGGLLMIMSSLVFYVGKNKNGGYKNE